MTKEELKQIAKRKYQFVDSVDECVKKVSEEVHKPSLYSDLDSILWDICEDIAKEEIITKFKHLFPAKYKKMQEEENL